MKDSASLEPKMLHPEQVSEPKPDEKPWLRQKNEPALWFMRFNRYLEMGPKRSLRKAVAAEPDSKKAPEGTGKNQETKKLSDVSIPGAWKRASKVWNWVERAAAYDIAQQAKEAVLMRKMAGTQEFSSRSYRLLQLNYAAKCVQKLLESIDTVQGGGIKTFLAIIARYQSVMRDIDALMQGLDVADDIIDAAALYQVSKEIIENKYKNAIKNAKTQLSLTTLQIQRQEELDELKKKR